MKSHEGDVDSHQSKVDMSSASFDTQNNEGYSIPGSVKTNLAIGELLSNKGESRNNDGKKVNLCGTEIIFTGITVSMRQKTIPQESGRVKAEYNTHDSLEATVNEIQQLLDRRSVVTVRVLLDWMGSTSLTDLERALPLCGYMFEDGPWKKALIKFGVDPRTGPKFRHYQTVTFEMDFGPIVEQGKHDWAKKGELAFPNLLKADDNIPHVFNGTKFVPDDNTWQICDLHDALLRRIVSTSDIRPEVNHKDGFLWNGTMAKLEVIMRDKLVCIRDGGTPSDEDYVYFLSFPDRYQPPTGRDYFKYGLDFGQQYTQKQAYLRGRIVNRARKSAA
ncbi:hypothetical protein ABOM_011916 [Aspergillus bombycis]|uniref:Transcription factor IIIC subunit 5 HTH domain-containing protein n=1 Tax=Aspergillus bombycis TaxID=109264 RepID=A0A1F7ZJB5_9EURO|nr:hypothetical protein ABOM_011916 [Aspergillus bombycis]OGM39534.1 hypothetical protein ABOM_011916 [Aspergillus bombycis]